MPALPAAREPLDLRLVPAALAVWAVAWLGRLLSPGVLLPAAAVAVLVAMLLLAVRRGPRALVAAGVLGCAAASAAVTGLQTGSRTTGPLADLAARQAAVVVEGVLTDDPRQSVGPTVGRPLVVAHVRAEVVRSGGREHRLRAPVVVLSGSTAWLALLPSQRVRVEGRLRAPEAGADVAAALSDRGDPQVLTGPSAVQRAAGHLRAGLRAAVEPLPDAEGGLLPGLVVGDTSRLDPALEEEFRTLGLAHLTAVSGTNVAIVCGAVLLVARRCGVGVRQAPALAATALVGFVVLARPSPSVLRAAVMGLVGLVALSTGSRRAAMPALATAVLALLLVDPDLAVAPGFALSVLATGGLLVLAPAWRERLARRMPGWLADALAVPAAAQVACGPVVVAISGQLGLLSIPANLLAVPAVAPATVLGVLAALLAPVWLPAAQAVAWLGWLPSAWLVLLVRTGAELPGAGIGWPAGPPGAMLMLLATVLVLPLLGRRRPRLLLLATVMGVVVASTGLALARPGWPPAGWFLVLCDVGQGDLIVLNAGPASAVVVDTGPDPRLADRCLSDLGVHRVPLVVLTHLHADHVDGLPGVLAGRAVGAVQLGPVDDPELPTTAVLVQAHGAGAQVVRAALGERRTVGALSWTVLAPGRTFDGPGSRPNNNSLVLSLVVADVSVLLAGEVEPEAQRDLLARHVDLRADVLKVPHHGSRNQEPAFLDAVGAKVVLTPVGSNTYGHPSAETLDRLTAHGARSYRTDVDGDIALVHRGGRLLVVTRRGAGGPDRRQPGGGAG